MLVKYKLVALANWMTEHHLGKILSSVNGVSKQHLCIYNQGRHSCTLVNQHMHHDYHLPGGSQGPSGNDCTNMMSKS